MQCFKKEGRSVTNAKILYQTRGDHWLLREKSGLMPSFLLSVVIPAQEIVDPGRELIQSPIAGGSISLF
jgi:hypothetical protein